MFFGACAHDHEHLEELAVGLGFLKVERVRRLENLRQVYLIRQRIALEALPRTAFLTGRRGPYERGVKMG